MADVGLLRLAEGGDLAGSLAEAAAAHAYVAVLRDVDEALPEALDEVRSVLDAEPGADIVYGDELVAGDGGDEPFYKPAWSPERLRCRHLLSGLTVYRADIARRAVGLVGADAPTASAALHDLALAAGELATSVVHVPVPLARLDGDPGGLRLDPAAVQRHLDRRGLPMRAVPSPYGEHLVGFEPALEHHPLVSIVVPTGGTVRRVRGRDLVLVDNAIASLLERSSYPDYEIVAVVDHKSTDELAAHLRSLAPDRLRVVKDTRPFNFAAAANLGVEASTGDVVLLLNDDTEVIQADWIERLVALTADDGVGAVGAKLFYGDGRIQHAGVTIRRLRPDHTYHGYPGDVRGHGDEVVTTINTSSTTGACLAVRRAHWDAVGGMTEDFPLNYNDVDLCLKLDARGWRTVVDNTTTLTHLETSSRPQGSESWEDDAFVAAWPRIAEPDPFDSPNFVDLGMEHLPKPPALVRLGRIVSGGSPRPRVVRTTPAPESPHTIGAEP